jgi:hypothetical protein
MSHNVFSLLYNVNSLLNKALSLLVIEDMCLLFHMCILRIWAYYSDFSVSVMLLQSSQTQVIATVALIEDVL